MNQLTNESIGDSADIFEVLRTGILGQAKTTLNPLFHDKEKDSRTAEDDAGTKYRGEAKAVYQKAVFFFSLMSELKYSKKSSTSILWTATKTDMCFQYGTGYLDTYCTYQSKKKGSSRSYPTVPYQQWANRKNDNKLNWRPHATSRGLSDWDMNAHFVYYDMTSPTGPLAGLEHIRVRVHK